MSEDKTNEPLASRADKLICLAVFLVAVIVAAWLRFDQIGIKPFHHDEGVNSYFLLNLANSGNYKYDPTNYHGPTLYYFALVALRIFGETDLALRFSPILFGLLTVAMVWLLRDKLGNFGTPVAAFLMALSPCLVYYSRDFIHEMSFGCFSLGIVVGAWRYAESKDFIWLALASISAGLLFATKETAIVTAVVLVVAVICAAIWDAVRILLRERCFTPAALVKELKNDLVAILPTLDHLFAALIIFIFINVFFYSSLFTNSQGVRDAVKSVIMWTGRSGNEHVKNFWYYFGILFKLELPLLLGSLLAGLIVVWRGTRFWLFAAAWTLGMTLAYSIIGYKTPWLMISFVIPMALVCGYAAEQVYQLLPGISLKLVWAAGIAVVLIFCGRLTWRVNFQLYDDNGNEAGYFVELGKKLQLKPYVDGQYGYVYAQTDRRLLGLVEDIKREAAKMPTHEATGIYVASPDYWPLPWYLRDYKQTAYSGNWPVALGEKPNFTQPIVIANANQQSHLEGVEGWRKSAQTYVLRPGVELMLFIRDEPSQQ
ncbi:MAG TPA: TIGR03663 family protein [Blastocatellia bacterium]|nr:TIGR03663 family protein [Blastocatellia bacterium]HMX24346.1 TIGR03663 family protein [Blastocatellia bacterium]HMZ16557.1 TIGR03663 family protein [Blastocatellia bacterium]HNG31639.1 TIGR03663 family protein [Blastocatellia bacterium]